MRLFVAIDLDDDARLAIAAEQKRLTSVLARAGRSTPKWVRVDQMHVRLVFIGEIAEARAERIVDAMHAEIGMNRFRMVFAGLGVFPARGAPNVLWLGVTCGAAEATLVQRRVADRLEPLGVAPEARAYHPHLTLARWREAGRADRESALAADRGAGIAGVDVAAVTLYQSHLSSHGPTYASLAQAPLR